MIITIILGLIGLGLVIFIHELGHFVMAKSVKIDVESFALGWGPKLVGFTKGKTEYKINILPIGGYCRMKGEYEFKEAIEKKMAAFPYSEGSLFSVTPLKRLLTYAAGPFFNILFAIILFSIVWTIGYDTQTFTNRIIIANDYPAIYGESQVLSPAELAGLQSGDTIISIDDSPINSFADIQSTLIDQADKELTIIFEHEGKTISSTLIPELNKKTGAGVMGIAPWIAPVIESIPETSMLIASDLIPGDLILAIDETSIHSVIDIYNYISLNNSKEHLYTILRDGEQKTITVLSEYDTNGHPVFNAIFPLLIVSTPDYPPLQSLGKGISETFSTFGLAFHSIALLFQGLDLKESMAGPIKITYLVGTATSQSFSEGFLVGITTVFRLLGFISVALCFANLLPIPALDGGQMIVSVTEMILHRGFSPQNYYRLQLIGFGILITIMILTLFNDISFFMG